MVVVLPLFVEATAWWYSVLVEIVAWQYSSHHFVYVLLKRTQAAIILSLVLVSVFPFRNEDYEAQEGLVTSKVGNRVCAYVSLCPPLSLGMNTEEVAACRNHSPDAHMPKTAWPLVLRWCHTLCGAWMVSLCWLSLVARLSYSVASLLEVQLGSVRAAV